MAARILRSARREAIATLDIQAGTRVLLLGGGTGLDLPFLPRDIELEVIDASPAMLRRCRERAETLGFDANVKPGDAMALDFPDGYFDVVIAHLIIAVVPRPQRAFDEALRVLASDGELSLLDKGLRGNRPAGRLRRLLNPLAHEFTGCLQAFLPIQKVDVLLPRTCFETKKIHTRSAATIVILCEMEGFSLEPVFVKHIQASPATLYWPN